MQSFNTRCQVLLYFWRIELVPKRFSVAKFSTKIVVEKMSLMIKIYLLSIVQCNVSQFFSTCPVSGISEALKYIYQNKRLVLQQNSNLHKHCIKCEVFDSGFL